MDADRLRRFLELLAECDLGEYDAMFDIIHAARISAYGPSDAEWSKLAKGQRVTIIPALHEGELRDGRYDKDIGRVGTLVSKGGYAAGIVFDDEIGQTDEWGRQIKRVYHGKRIRPVAEERQ